MYRRLLPSPWLTALLVVFLSGAIGWWLLERDGSPGQPAAATVSGNIDWAGVIAGLGYEESFQPPAGPWRLSLPSDHGAHPGTRSESWSLSGTLTRGSQEVVGIQLGLLRVALAPKPERASDSPWRTVEVYRGHLILSDVDAGAVTSAERYSRAAVGLAGHDPAAGRVWLEDWALSYGLGKDGRQLRFEARTRDSELQLLLSPQKTPVGGDQGQSAAPFRGFALTRLTGDGMLIDGSGEEPVSGTLWLDHLWGEVPLPLGPIVWDRLQLQLDDGSEIFALRTRRRDGRGLATVSGYRVDHRGKLSALEDSEARFAPTASYWQDEGGGASYPLRWELATDELTLVVEPLLEAQVHDFAIPLWSGIVSARGSTGGKSVSGTGFLELTGY